MDSVTRRTDSMESSRSHLECRSNLARSSSSDRELSQHAYHQPSTRPGGRYHKGCGKNLAGEQRSGEHSVAGFDQYKSQYHEGSKPE